MANFCLYHASSPPQAAIDGIDCVKLDTVFDVERALSIN